MHCITELLLPFVIPFLSPSLVVGSPEGVVYKLPGRAAHFGQDQSCREGIGISH